MNLESRKEKKGTSMKEHFILLLLLLFSYFLNRSRPLGDQTSTFSRPGHFFEYRVDSVKAFKTRIISQVLFDELQMLFTWIYCFYSFFVYLFV